MLTKKLIIFDFDGTIADTLSFGIETFNNHASHFGVQPIKLEDVSVLKGKTAPEILKILQVPFYKLPFLYNLIQSEMKKSILSLKIFPGLKEVLIALEKKNHSLGIITSSRKENIELFLKQYHIDVFDFIHSESNIFGKDKVIRNVLHSHELRPEEVTYIGDEVRDIQASQKVGVDIIAVTWGFNSKKILTAYHPTHLVDEPEEILQLL